MNNGNQSMPMSNGESNSAYVAPKLERFGSLADLTASGTTGSTENNMGQGQTTKRP